MRIARCLALWFVLALPFSPSLWALYHSGGICFNGGYPDEHGAVSCILQGFVIAPFAVIFGPIAHGDEDPINPWPSVLTTALIVAVTIEATVIVYRWRSRRVIQNAAPID